MKNLLGRWQFFAPEATAAPLAEPRPTVTMDDDGWVTDTADSPTSAENAEAADLIRQTRGADPSLVEPTPETEPARDRKGRFERGGFGSRHRAQSQQATSDDAPRINELTAKWRTAERERDELRAKYEGRPAPAPVGAPGAAPAASEPRATEPGRPAAVPARPSRPPLTPPPAFTQAEPKLDDFATDADPLTAYHRALSRYDRAKEQHDLATRYVEQETKRRGDEDSAANHEYFSGLVGDHNGRLTAAMGTDAALKTLIEASGDTYIAAPVALAFMQAGDKSVPYLRALLEKPGLLDDLNLASLGKETSDALVAILQRRLASATQAAGAPAPIGSAASPRSTPAPRPPNPIRTAPEAPPKDLPGDDASWDDHRSAFHRPRQSRLRRN